MKVFGFAFAGKVRIIGNDDLQQARECISEAADFDRIANVIDPDIEKPAL